MDGEGVRDDHDEHRDVERHEGPEEEEGAVVDGAPLTSLHDVVGVVEACEVYLEIEKCE